jgi:hypothetical protein
MEKNIFNKGILEKTKKKKRLDFYNITNKLKP